MLAKVIVLNDGKSDPSISLSSEAPFAEGGHRLCYQHPACPHLCIKVNRPGWDHQLWQRAPFFRRLLRPVSSFNDNWMEFKAFQQFAIRQNQPEVLRHIPQCYGWIHTDLGPGLVTNFFADKNGMPCETLATYLHRCGLDETILAAVAEFRDFMRRYRVITKNLLPHNLLVMADERGALRLVLIDGFGSLSLFPNHLFPPLSRRYVEKRLRLMDLRIRWEVSDKRVTWEETEAKG